MVDMRAAKELLLIDAWLGRVGEIVERGREADLAAEYLHRQPCRVVPRSTQSLQRQPVQSSPQPSRSRSQAPVVDVVMNYQGSPNYSILTLRIAPSLDTAVASSDEINCVVNDSS